MENKVKGTEELRKKLYLSQFEFFDGEYYLSVALSLTIPPLFAQNLHY